MLEIISDDDIDYDLVKAASASSEKKFDIVSVNMVDEPKTFVIQGEPTNGVMKRISARRPEKLKEKYLFPDHDPECDNIQHFQPPPIYGIWRLALNEMGLYRHYFELKNKTIF